jgi:predicted DNA binding CopG/RHH family protein
MEKKKNKLPDFSKMTRNEEAKWFDTHDMGDYREELKPVDVVVELAKPKEETLILRVNKELKKKLEKKAEAKGLTPSSLARIWLTEKLGMV